MNYEKKYKEALERARKLHKDAITLQLEQDIKDYEHIFPELAESDDERIRKELIAYHRSMAAAMNGNIPCVHETWITWLEKQGSEPKWCHHKVDLSGCSEEYRKAYYDGWNNCNQQHSQCKSELNDVVKCLINGMKFYYEDNEEATWGTDKWSMPVKHIIEVLEKQGEQKSFDYENATIVQKDFAPKVEPKFKVKYAGSEYNVLEVKDIAGVTFYGIEDEPNHIDYVQAENCERVGCYSIKENGSPYPTKPAVFSEQKSDWSEEDYSKVQIICKYLNEAKKYYADITEVRDCVDWLKSLKDRVQPQPKQEWSEEDESYLNTTIAYLKDAKEFKKTAENCIIWLKSIRPQNTWKPSDEQLNALHDAAVYVDKSMFPYPKGILMKLYKQLKKVREE